MILDQCGTALHPVAVVDVPDWTNQPLFGAMHVPAYKTVGSRTPDGLKHFTIIEIGWVLNYSFDTMAQIGGHRTSLAWQMTPFTGVPLTNTQCHRVGLISLEPLTRSDRPIELMSMCYQHATALDRMMNQFSAAGHQSEQGLDQVETRLVMIARQKLDACAALTPGSDLLYDGLLRIVEIPRWAAVPAVDYIAHKIKPLSLVMAQKIEQNFRLALRRTEVEVR
jgi:hypothetical protein